MRSICAFIPALFLAAPLWAYTPTITADCDGWQASATGITKGISCATVTLEVDIDGVWTVLETVDLVCVVNLSDESFDYGTGLWATELVSGEQYRACLSGVLWQGLFDEVPADLSTLGTPNLTGSDCSDEFGDCGTPPTTTCPKSPCYWKNHPGEWPLEEVTIGGMVYDKDCLLEFLCKRSCGDVRVGLVQQLVAAKLNLANGVDPVSYDGMEIIDSFIAEADAFLAPSMASCDEEEVETPYESCGRRSRRCWSGWFWGRHFYQQKASDGILEGPAPCGSEAWAAFQLKCVLSGFNRGCF